MRCWVHCTGGIVIGAEAEASKMRRLESIPRDGVVLQYASSTIFNHFSPVVMDLPPRAQLRTKPR